MSDNLDEAWTLKAERQEEPNKKYWYYTTTYTCVLCGHTDVYRERRYTPKPSNYKDRYDHRQDACGQHFF